MHGIDGDRIVEMCQNDEQGGFCISCGEEAYGVEPDARRYKCESCNERTVYGAQELLIMGYANESDLVGWE